MANGYYRRIVSVFLCFCMLFVLSGAFSASATAQESVTPQVSVGNGFIVALSADGIAYSWGSNFAGVLGNGTQDNNSTVPMRVEMPSGVRFASVSAGWNHVIALSTEGKLYTWGSNAYGQLGFDTVDYLSKPKEIPFSFPQKIVSVAAGNSFSLALTENGEVYAWGINEKGQLGASHESLKNTYKPQPITVLSGRGITSIYAGNTTGAAITADGKVWLWGDNTDCQCGSITAGSVSSPVLKSSASYFAVDVALGDHHSSFVELNGSVKSFGINLYGQFGNGEVLSDNPSVKLTSALLPEGVVAKQISAGERHCVMISTAGEVYSFGDNSKGQLGDSSAASTVSTPQKVNIPMGDAKVISLDACGSTTAVVDSNGLVWTWGGNDCGQLGNGSYLDASAPVGVVDGKGERLFLGSTSYTTVYQSMVTVNATVPAPSYSVEIPSTLSLGELKLTDAREDGSHILSAELKITATDVNYLFGEKSIRVTVNAEGGSFALADGEYRLPYSVYGAIGEDALLPGDTFAVFTQSQSVVGKITVDQSLITREGSYKGRLIFEVSVEDLDKE